MELSEQAQIQLIKDVSEIKQMVVDIKEQTTKTNGTVRRHDEWINQQKGGAKIAVWIWGAIIALVNIGFQMIKR
jgi:hypothetical protein